MSSIRLVASRSTTLAWNEALVCEQRDDYVDSSLANLTLSGDDGRIPVHPFLLSAASPKIKEFLKDHDLSEPSFIHFDGVNVKTICQMAELVYIGKTKVAFSDQAPLFTFMVMLGMPMEQIMLQKLRAPSPPPRSKKSSETAKSSLRFFPNVKKDSEKPLKTESEHSDEENKENDASTSRNLRRSSINRPGLQPQEPGSSSSSSTTILPVTNNISAENSKPKRTSGHKKNDWKYESQCIVCKRYFTIEQYMVKHLYSRCADHLREKYDYITKTCRVCKRGNIANNIWALLSHASLCSGDAEEDVEIGDYRKFWSNFKTPTSQNPRDRKRLETNEEREKDMEKENKSETEGEEKGQLKPPGRSKRKQTPPLLNSFAMKRRKISPSLEAAVTRTKHKYMIQRFTSLSQIASNVVKKAKEKPKKRKKDIKSSPVLPSTSTSASNDELEIEPPSKLSSSPSLSCLSDCGSNISSGSGRGGMKFLREEEIKGVKYNIFSNPSDKIIAIPVPRSKQ